MRAHSIPLFNSISLDELDRVSFMNRKDTKYWMHADQLPTLLQSIQAHYAALDISGNQLQTYASAYFDTPGNDMYLAHHNGRVNRYKVRKRSYIESNLAFLEVKFKSNTGRTDKQRMETNFQQLTLLREECAFMKTHTPFACEDLEVKLHNQFRRLTLINLAFDERCTIDLDLRFHTAQTAGAIENLVILEIKTEKHTRESPLARSLRSMSVHPFGLSKYCLGRASCEPRLKQNRFKEGLLAVKKLTPLSQQEHYA